MRHDAAEFDGPLWDRRFHPVYEIQVGYRRVRSYADVDAAYRRDDRFGVALGILIVALGIGVLVMPARFFRGSAG